MSLGNHTHSHSHLHSHSPFTSMGAPEHQKQRAPIVVLAVVCCIVGVWSVFSLGLADSKWQTLPLALSGAMIGLISFFEIRVGLAALLLAIGLSPEVQIFGIDNFRYEDILFPILFFVWITKHIMMKPSFLATDLRFPIMVTLFLALVSSLNNHIYEGLNLGTAGLRFGKSVMYYFMFFMVLNSLKTFKDVRLFSTLMIITSSLVGLYGLMQFSLYYGQDGYRVSGPPGETANILGGYFVFHMCLGMGLFAFANKTARGLLGVYLIIMLIPFSQTLSRTSYVAFLIGTIVICVASRKLVLGWLLVALGLGVAANPERVTDRFLTVFGVVRGESVSSWDSRVQGWRYLFDSAIEAPIIGKGMGHDPLGAVDNEYVLQLNELGVVGLIVFLWLIFFCLRTSYRLIKNERENGDRTFAGFATGYFGGLIALLVHSIGATTFTTIRTTEPFFFATGILYVIWNLRQQNPKKSMQSNMETPVSLFDTANVGRVGPAVPEWKQHYLDSQSPENAPDWVQHQRARTEMLKKKNELGKNPPPAGA